MTHPNHTKSMAVSATLHCLTGCAIGEVLGLILGTVFGLESLLTVVLAIILAFVFGFTLSTLPLLKVGLGFLPALSIVAAADTLSIATMELVDNFVMVIIPGALHAGLTEPLFWVSMSVALIAAFFAALPVNKYLLNRNKGHALTMKAAGHHGHGHQHGVSPLLYGLIGFFIGGFLVAVAVTTFDKPESENVHTSNTMYGQ